MKRIYLLLSFLLIYISSFGQVLTINEVVKGETYTINGVTTGNRLIASEVDDSTIRIKNLTSGTSNDYKTTSSFSDFVIDGMNPTDVSSAVKLVNSIILSQPLSYVTPFNLELTKGHLKGHSAVDKFGENPDLSVGVAEDIWEFGGTYIYDADGTAPIQYLSSSDVLDTEPIRIIGLDIDGNEVSQTLTLTGQTVVNLTTALWRVYRMENEGTSDLEGTVYCHIDPIPTLGVPLSINVRAIIDDGNNQSLMALYTVPKGKVGFLFRGEIGGSRAVSQGETQAAYYSRRLGKVFKIKKRVNISNSGSSIYQDSRSFPDIIPSLTDIKLRVEDVSSNNTGVFGTFDILLIDETQFSTAYLQAIGQPGY